MEQIDQLDLRVGLVLSNLVQQIHPVHQIHPKSNRLLEQHTPLLDQALVLSDDSSNTWEITMRGIGLVILLLRDAWVAI